MSFGKIQSVSVTGQRDSHYDNRGWILGRDSKFFPNGLDWFWGHPASCQWVRGALRPRESCLGVELTTCLHAVMKLIASGVTTSPTRVSSLAPRGLL